MRDNMTISVLFHVPDEEFNQTITLPCVPRIGEDLSFYGSRKYRVIGVHYNLRSGMAPSESVDAEVFLRRV
jgi:hypothetical protein